MELVELRDNRLEEGGDRHHLFDFRWQVANAELERRKKRMRPHVPPDLLRVVDAARLDEQVDVRVELTDRTEVVRNISPRKLLEDLAAITLQSGVPPDPERRARRQRQNVRQKVPRRVHQMHRGVAVINSDVNVHSEDQQRARHVLHLLDEQVVTLVRRDLRRLPVRERMRRRRRDSQSLLRCKLGNHASEANDVGTSLLDVGADSGPDLDHRLMHLGLHLLPENHLALIDHFGDVRLQVARHRVDDLELFFDSQREVSH